MLGTMAAMVSFLPLEVVNLHVAAQPCLVADEYRRGRRSVWYMRRWCGG